MGDCATIVAHLCQLPIAVRMHERMTARGIVEESGVCTHRECLTRDAIRAYLHEHRDLVEAWRGYSGDKRTSEGWFIDTRFDANDPTKIVYLVGYYPKGTEFRFEDVFEACADFVVREVESLLNNELVSGR